MSNKQIRERALEVVASQKLFDYGCRQIDWSYPLNALAVAQAWLAEHPEDDEQGVDTKWLLSVGFRWSEDESIDSYLLINNPTSGNEFDLIYLPTSCVWLLSDEINELTLDIRTRGDVRRLCRALRVELGEGR